MSVKEKENQEFVEKVWRAYLDTGDFPEFVTRPWYTSKRLRPFYLRLPAEPRCQACYYPFHGFGGSIMRRVFGIEPSQLNPHLCNLCEKFLENYQGGAEVELTILFADVRGSTRMAESMKPSEYSHLINRFYNAATQVLFNHGAMVEKLAGDAITAFFTQGFSGPDHSRIAIEAGKTILEATGHGQSSGPWIPVGIGIHTGEAFVGSMHSDSGARDIAVLGDTANTGARLASLAGAGEIYISADSALKAGLDSASAEVRRLELRGRSEPVEVWVV
jgi:adenylate cyclase